MGACHNACHATNYVQVARSDELHQQATKYCAQLQEFNGRLQSDSQSATERLKTLQASARPPANIDTTAAYSICTHACTVLQSSVLTRLAWQQTAELGVSQARSRASVVLQG